MINKSGNAYLGFTLLELLVVIAIISIISFVTVGNLLNFQNDAKLDAFTKEFASTLQTARNRSVNSETPSGVAGFDTYLEDDTLPFWAVNISPGKYSLYSKYKRSSDPGFTISTAEDTLIPSGNSITPNTEVIFERLSGNTTASSFTVSVSGYTRTEIVNMDNFGNITITK